MAFDLFKKHFPVFFHWFELGFPKKKHPKKLLVASFGDLLLIEIQRKLLFVGTMKSTKRVEKISFLHVFFLEIQAQTTQAT